MANAILVANWKMNPPTMRDAKRLFEATRKAAEAAKSVSVIVAPPSIFLREIARGYKGRRISFAAQHMHFEHTGSYTGEISPLQVRDATAHYVLVGHAERRAMGETNEQVGKKLAAAFAAKLVPILCVGEQSRSQGGEHFTFVREQLRAALAVVPPARIGKLLIAYEPVWAIGARKAMSPREMHEMAIFIRKTVVEQAGPQGMKVRVLYGGAVDASNATDMLLHGDVAGFVVGRASVDARQIAALIESISA